MYFLYNIRVSILPVLYDSPNMYGSIERVKPAEKKFLIVHLSL